MFNSKRKSIAEIWHSLNDAKAKLIMPRLEEDKKPEELHEKNTSTEAENRREDVTPPNTSEKKEGVTSSFSAATSDDARKSGEDNSESKGETGSDQDKIAN